MNSNIEKVIRMLVNEIKEAEGFSPVLYKCSKGILTIGHGIALTRGLSQEEKERLGVDSILKLKHISEKDSEYLLKNEIYDIVEKLEKLDWIYNVPIDKVIVIIDCIYNMGFDGFMKFTKTIDAIQNGQWTRAMTELLDSQYFKDVKGRALRNAFRLGGLEISLKEARQMYKVISKRVGGVR